MADLAGNGAEGCACADRLQLPMIADQDDLRPAGPA
jgi:hypothetical protein